MALLSIDGLSVGFELGRDVVPTLIGVSLEISPGETLGIVGESGSGKSLTARAIMGLLPPGARITGGRIDYSPEGQAPTNIADLAPRGRQIRALRAREIAMIFQEPMASLSPVHTIATQIATPLRQHFNLSKRAAEAEALDWLARVGMPAPRDVSTQYPHQISGGMRQRAMIAIALACRPNVLICDEPTTALDVTTEAQIVTLLSDLQADLRMAMIFISHNVALVSHVAEQVAVMYLGEIVELGPRARVLGAPSHPYTRGLLRSIPGLTPAGHRLETLTGTVPEPVWRPPGCAFHPRCPDRIGARCDKEAPCAQTHAKTRVKCHLYG